MNKNLYTRRSLEAENKSVGTKYKINKNSSCDSCSHDDIISTSFLSLVWYLD